MKPIRIRSSLLPKWQQQIGLVHRLSLAESQCLVSQRALQKRCYATPLAATEVPNDGRERVVILGSGWAGLSPSSPPVTRPLIHSNHRLRPLAPPLPQKVPHNSHLPTVLLRLHASPQ